MKKLVLIVVVVSVLGACATTKPPTQKMTQLETSIQQAEQVGAEEYAPLEIREAKKKLEKAKQLVNDEDYKEAKLIADRAMVDAELAEIKSLSKKSQDAVKQLRESIKTLQEEIQNNLDDDGV